jgi:hypothetical protein
MDPMRAHGQRQPKAGCLGITCLVLSLLAILPHEVLAKCSGAEAGQFPLGARQPSCTREPSVPTSPATLPRENVGPRENTSELMGHEVNPQRFGQRIESGFDRAGSFNGAEREQALAHLDSARLSAVNRFSTGGPDVVANDSSTPNRSLDAVPWADSRDWVHNPPQILRDIRNYRRQGVPIIRLVNSAQTVVAFGVSNHGKPGLYFFRKLPF